MRKGFGALLIVLGILMIIGAGGLVGYNLWDSSRATEAAENYVSEVASRMPETVTDAVRLEKEVEVLVQMDAEEPTIDIPYYVLNPEIEMVEQEIDGIPYIGLLEIPALDLELPIISQWSTSYAKISPCRYAGSAYTDDLIICAHNYRSHFGRLSSLSTGDLIMLTDMEGNLFRYEVLEFEIIDGTHVSRMEEGDWDLALFTCTVGGKSRFTVRCIKMAE